jgi:glycerol-3-phosphate dehydrogenase subunit C
MSTVYSPTEPRYFDESDLRQEMLRVFEICHSCRLCFNLCPSFPALFKHVDAHDGDVTALTREEQDEVVDKCYQCKLCYNKCPYVPPHEWQLDFPRLMLRATTVRRNSKQLRLRDRAADAFMARTDLLGAVGTLFAGPVNAMMSRPHTIARRLVEATAGVSSTRVLPPYAKQRFSTWWRRRGGPALRTSEESASLFATCFVEYMAPEVGKAVVEALEMASVSITVPAPVRCCGAPYLHSGDVEGFIRLAESNVARLAVDVAQGKKVVVPQPTCGYVIKKDYPLYLDSDAARQVAANSFDAAEYLTDLIKRGRLEIKDAKADGKKVAYHPPCHLKAQNVGMRSRDLLAAAGYKVRLVDACSGIDGTWGYKSRHADLSREVGQKLFDMVRQGPEDELVAGDCHLANTAVEEGTGKRPLHPVELFVMAMRGGGAA